MTHALSPSPHSSDTIEEDIVVIGAGVVGISTAYWLARAGRSVTVVDRQAQPGMETSYANGGQISVCHAEPWANPHAPMQVLKWLCDPTAPLLFTPQRNTQQWQWLAKWLLECLPGRSVKNTREIVELALYSRETLRNLREELKLEYQHRTDGILHFYRTKTAFDLAKPVSKVMRDAGCERQIVNKDQVLALEPALSPIQDEIIGGTYTEHDESGNAHLYCKALEQECIKLGVKFLFNHRVERISPNTQTQSLYLSAEQQQKQINSQYIVIAAGSWSRQLLTPLGININLYPAKGYSVTIPIQNADAAPVTSLTDDEHKLVFSRLGNSLRVAGTAELSGYSTDINHIRCHSILNKVQHYFPDMGGFDDARFWAGLRPSTPSNVPIIGQSKHPGIWVNTGHGTLGWTMSCGSGKRLAEKLTNSVIC